MGIAASNAVHLSNETRITLFSYFTDPVGSEAGSFSAYPEIQMRLPIKLSVYYLLPLRSRIDLFISGGVGAYSGRMAESMDYELTDDIGAVYYRSQWETQWKSAIGAHVGLGIEYHLSARLALVVDAQYRLAKIGNFTAAMNAESNLWWHPRNYDPEGRLYRWGWGEDGPMGLGYEELIVWSGTPPVYNPRDGSAFGKVTLDLSGLSLRLGFRLGLF